jgi:plasmid stabilization system protein ParE
MKYQLFWTATATDSYAAILNFIMEKYGVNPALKMDDKVEKILELLESNKQLCPPTETNLLVRRCVITKNLSLIYSINGNVLDLVTFYDNRADFNF